MTITSFRIFVVFPNEEFYSRELREVNLIRGGGITRLWWEVRVLVRESGENPARFRKLVHFCAN